MITCPSCNAEIKSPWIRTMFPCPNCKTLLHEKPAVSTPKETIVAILIVTLYINAAVLVTWGIATLIDLAQPRHTFLSGALFLLLFAIVSVGMLIILSRILNKTGKIGRLLPAIDYYRQFVFGKPVKYVVTKECPGCRAPLKLPRFSVILHITKKHPIICPDCHATLEPTPGSRKNYRIGVALAFLAFYMPALYLFMKAVGTQNSTDGIIAIVLFFMYIIVTFTLGRVLEGSLKLSVQDPQPNS